MNKLKWGLRLLTVCCVIFPLLFTFSVYQNNLLGMIVPPQIMNLMSGQNNQNSNNENALTSLFGIDPDNFVSPTLVGEPQFDNTTNTLSVNLNFTNPLGNQSLAINSMSVKVTDGNGTFLATLQLAHPVTLAPGQSGILSIDGAISEENMAYLANSNSTSLEGLQLSDFNADIGGIQVHLDNLNDLMS